MPFVTTQPEMPAAAQAMAIHELVTSTLGTSAGSYVATEADAITVNWGR